jgi:hypothetical protein
MTNQEDAPSPAEKPAAETKNENAADNRRELLTKLGRYGLYTAPALLSLFVSEKAPAQSGPLL